MFGGDRCCCRKNLGLLSWFKSISNRAGDKIEDHIWSRSNGPSLNFYCFSLSTPTSVSNCHWMESNYLYSNDIFGFCCRFHKDREIGEEMNEKGERLNALRIKVKEHWIGFRSDSYCCWRRKAPLPIIIKNSIENKIDLLLVEEFKWRSLFLFRDLFKEKNTFISSSLECFSNDIQYLYSISTSPLPLSFWLLRTEKGCWEWNYIEIIFSHILIKLEQKKVQ